MVRGQFTKEGADVAINGLKEILHSLPRRKRVKLLVQFNNLLLFICAARRAAPHKDELEAVLEREQGA